MIRNGKHYYKQSGYFVISFFFCFGVHAGYLLLTLVSTNIVLYLWAESVDPSDISDYVPIAINSLAILFAMFLSGFRLGRVKILVLPRVTIPSSAILISCIAAWLFSFNELNITELLLYVLLFLTAVLCSLVGCLLSLKIRRSKRKPPKYLPEIDEF